MLRKIHAWLTIFIALSLLLLLGVPSWGAQKDLTYRIYQSGNYREIEVRTALVSYVFSEEKGTLQSVFLTFSPYGSKSSELVPGTKTDPDDLERQYVANTTFPFTLLVDGAEVDCVLSTPIQAYEDEVIVEFKGEAGGIGFIKRFTIRNDPYYTVDMELVIDNLDSKDSSSTLHMILADHMPSKNTPDLVYLFDDAPAEALFAPNSYASFDGLGLMDKQTVFFLQPVDSTEVVPFSERTPAGSQRFGVSLPLTQGITNYSFSLYGGRRRFLLMESAGLGKLDSPGTMARMMVPVIQFLNFLYRHTGNYAWAIILFTVVTRVILFPLMRKQYHSMAKMQKLQPKLKKIQARFKDDRQLLQRKMMQLYKQEGVNPMGGCLPMFVQLPILILLWKAILYSAEQIHLSPGFLWIPDLSLRDPYFILVGITTLLMILQQRMMAPMTASSAGGSQKYMGYIFPIFMAIFLYSFPAGLWLYYLLTTLFQVGQQYFVNWEMAKAKTITSMSAAPAEGILDDGETDDGEDQSAD